MTGFGLRFGSAPPHVNCLIGYPDVHPGPSVVLAGHTSESTCRNTAKPKMVDEGHSRGRPQPPTGRRRTGAATCC